MPIAPSEILSSSGPISRLLGPSFESRPEQMKMAEAVAHAFESRERLLVEAGTGVGKSFAYLVPAVVRAISRGEKVVVATATISLQEQLMSKDIPFLQSSLSSWGLENEAGTRGELVAVLAKGRGNYLSIRRLQLASSRRDSIVPDEASRRSLDIIENWAAHTKEGSLSSLPTLERPEVWDHARSDADNCMGRKCPTYKTCFYQSARRELERANLIICNHALFFSDLAMRARTSGMGGILPAYDHVVLDEAHNIEDSACEHFGLTLAQPRVSRLLRTLYSAKRQRGYLTERALAIANAEEVDRAISLVHRAESTAADFFADLHALFRARPSEANSGGRLRRAGPIENTLTPAMRDLAIRLNLIKQAMDNEQDRLELTAFSRRATEIADCAEAMVDQTLDGYVYWVDIERDNSAGARFGPRVSLACAPTAVGELLKRYLWDPPPASSRSPIPDEDAGDEFDRELASPSTAASAPRSDPAPKNTDDKPKGIVLTSATLATRTARKDEHPERAETAFAHVMSNLGITSARTLQLGSPFDYAKQSRLIIDLSVPNPRAQASGPESPNADAPSSDAGNYIALLSRRITHHAQSTRGGAFVLFTSFGTLNACADACARELDRLDMPLLAQGRDGSRQLVLKNFLETPNAVLFGAASFWQGVDVRGEKLRNVIITRLPFEPPDRPLTQARIERIELTGASPFMQDSLPRAVIRFKQGFGRLIRSKSDRGQVVILDPRIKTARYGRMFIDALPEGVRVETVTNADAHDDDAYQPFPD